MSTLYVLETVIGNERVRPLEGVGVVREFASQSYDDGDPLPGLPRVIDALSTIIWPSVIRLGRHSGGRVRKGQAAPLTSLEGKETLGALMEADAADSGAGQTRASCMQK